MEALADSTVRSRLVEMGQEIFPREQQTENKAAAIRNLPRKQAGAGSGVYNTTRQIGSVLGSASIGALIQARPIADLPGGANAANSLGGARFSGTIPASLQAGFTAAMAQSVLLPAAVAAVGALIVVFFTKPTRNRAWE